MKGPYDQSLARISRIYGSWGRHPRLYALQDWITFMGRPGAIRSKAVEAMEVDRGARVLEVACGTGRNFEYVIDAIGPEGDLVGTDYSARMLEAARDLCESRGFANVGLQRLDAASGVVGDGGFDGVLCVLGMSAIPDHIGALVRCRSHLKRGGRLSVCDATRFPGRLAGPLNAVVGAVYGRFAAWHPDRDVPADMRMVFGNVTVERFNLGSFYLATSTKK